MNLNVCLGRKFDDHHQIAIILTRHLGLDGARRRCAQHGWRGVLKAIDEQQSIVTIPN